MVYAGFWLRFVAACIDSLITMLASFIIGVMFGPMMEVGDINDPGGMGGLGDLWGIMLGWLYFAGMESSTAQGTLGKMALGIIVTDLDGHPVSFGRATGRYFGKIISTLMLFIGFIMVGFTARKQGLHDMMAGCLVLRKVTKEHHL